MNYLERARELRKVIEQAITSVDDETALAAVELSPSLTYSGALIKSGTRINWNGKLYRAAVDLWDSVDNNPDNAANLWEEVVISSGYREIPETITVGLAFAKGECGWWHGVLYESLVENNVYTPAQYPANWKVKE